MNTYVIRFNEKNNQAKRLLEFIKELAKNTKSISIEKIPNTETLQSIDDVKKGKVFYAENADELFNQLNE